jgi:UDP-N-acetylmuramate dehydrogenase
VIPPAAREALGALLAERVRWDEPLSRHTSLRVGGPADALATPATREELAALVALCAEHGVPYVALGGGFNTLVLDGGIEGVVIQPVRLRRLHAERAAAVLAEAGVSHHRLTRFCVQHGLAGLEFGAGIPGTVGGWVAMNAGVPEREAADVLTEAFVALPGGEKRLSCAELAMEYRAARGLPEGGVVAAARFRVEQSTREKVQAEVDRHLSHRSRTQPIDQPSCGSVFKNPPRGHAGRLIEEAGLKGLREGGAELSTLHANFIVNRGGATAADVLALIGRARDAVRTRTGTVLETEVRIVGREP